MLEKEPLLFHPKEAGLVAPTLCPLSSLHRRFLNKAGVGLARLPSSSYSPAFAACAHFCWDCSHPQGAAGPAPEGLLHPPGAAQPRTADPSTSFLEALPLWDADPHMAWAKGFIQQPLEGTSYLERLVLRSDVIQTCHPHKLGQK